MREKFFPKSSLPILLMILGLIFAIGIFCRPVVKVYYVPEYMLTTTTTTAEP
jgi:hypothetical protein